MIDEIVNLLKDNNLKLSFAESCTGGLLSAKVVNVSGASEVFNGGFVTYNNEMKMSLLGVDYDTLNKYSAVSKECAMEMAKGCKSKTGADISLSVTGYAGPGDTPEEPKGLVYIGYAYGNIVSAREFRFTGERNTIRNKAVERAIELIKEIILEYKGK